MPVILITIVVTSIVWLCVELAIFSFSYFIKKKFKWITFPQDAFVDFRDTQLINGFLSTFDPELGWLRKPLSVGVDETDQGPVSFSIDERGRRECCQLSSGSKSVVVFGDSFAFCRMVENNEAWPCKLGNLLGWRVENFGVGNYGVDQAVLRFERELAKGSAPDYAVLAFVPETMARIHSYWKHFFEYGNVLAFKPIFKLSGAELKYIPPAVSSLDDLRNFEKFHADIISNDIFYERKFLKDTLRFPFTLSLLRNKKRNFFILYTLFLGIFGDFRVYYRRAFNHVLRCNAGICAELYRQSECQQLLDAILQRFIKNCSMNGIRPIIVLIPQEIDLKVTADNSPTYYQGYFKKFEKTEFFFDLTDKMREWDAETDLFVHGNLGPHLSAAGNSKIAHFFASVLSKS